MKARLSERAFNITHARTGTGIWSDRSIGKYSFRKFNAAEHTKLFLLEPYKHAAKLILSESRILCRSIKGILIDDNSLSRVCIEFLLFSKLENFVEKRRRLNYFSEQKPGIGASRSVAPFRSVTCLIWMESRGPQITIPRITLSTAI